MKHISESCQPYIKLFRYRGFILRPRRNAVIVILDHLYLSVLISLLLFMFWLDLDFLVDIQRFWSKIPDFVTCSDSNYDQTKSWRHLFRCWFSGICFDWIFISLMFWYLFQLDFYLIVDVKIFVLVNDAEVIKELVHL